MKCKNVRMVWVKNSHNSQYMHDLIQYERFINIAQNFEVLKHRTLKLTNFRNIDFGVAWQKFLSCAGLFYKNHDFELFVPNAE